MTRVFKKIIYRILAFCGIQKKRLAVPAFRYNIFSQDGDDGIIEYALKKLPALPTYVLDIGANDGVTTSNSRLLISKYGWRGLLIEPFADAYRALMSLYQGNERVQLCNKAVGTATATSTISWHGHFSNVETEAVEVNALLRSYEVPKEIGVFSIDIDGKDNQVLAAINWKEYSPWIVNAEIDSSSERNLDEQVAIMDKAGYFPFVHIGNVIYYRKDLAGKILFNWRTNPTFEHGFFWK